MKTFKSYGASRTHFTELAAWLSGGEVFSNQDKTFRGFPVEPGSLPFEGRMTGEELKAFKTDLKKGLVDYVIYSYGTPIAWHVKESGKVKARWVEPDVKYSKTTTNHQGHVATALETMKVWS